ncbi:MAG: hypothetical protein HKN45_04240, partial [Flavobacteriales bacterium]|nr:hypothetical protein [Flavobacteriales bacterium]
MLKSRSGIFIFMLCIILLMMRAWYLPVRALTWDIFGYYLYLPAHFVHDDILLQEKEWQDSLMKDYRPSSTYYQLVPLENGNTVIKYSMGMAVALSPFYFIADGLASSTGHRQNGFSLPYQLILSLGGLVYAFFGLILLARLVKRYFDQRVVIWTLGIIFFGTNYLHLTAWDGTLLTHNILFTFYALLLLATDNWHKKPRWSQAFLVGLSLGMIALIRPSEAVAFFIPLLWGIGDKESFANKWKLITNKPKHILLLLITGLVTVLPQLLYWKAATGEFLFFSYTNAGEGMDLSNPHIKEFLFSFRKGWFVYTPLMFLALLGFWRIWKVKKTLFWPLLIFLVLDVYIASSWTTWWYAGGSFSSR